MDSAIALNSAAALRARRGDLSWTLAGDLPTSVTRTSMRRRARRRGRKRDVLLQVAIAVMKAGSLRLDEAVGSFFWWGVYLYFSWRDDRQAPGRWPVDGKVRRC